MKGLGLRGSDMKLEGKCLMERERETSVHVIGDELRGCSSCLR